MTKISRTQLFFMLIWVILGTGLMSIPLTIARFSARGGWIVALFFIVGALTALFTTWVVNKNFPSISFLQALNVVYGPWVGRLLALIGLLWVYLFLCMVLRELNLFVEMTILPKTPLYWISALGLVPVAYAVYQGLESVARVTELFSIVMLPIIVVLMILPLNVADLHLLRPFIAGGWDPIFRAALTPDVSFALEFTIAIYLLGDLAVREKVHWDILKAALVVTFILCVMEVLIIAVLGPAADYFTFPSLEVIRSIRYGQFIERLDTALVLIILTMMFVKLATFHYVFCDLLRYVFTLSSIRVVAFAGVVPVWAGSVLFWKNSVALHNYMMFVTPTLFVVVLQGIPWLTVAIWPLKKKFSSASS
ncbi:endospore germination permease [Alicyclobacillus curvatus]|nr:endospore germination permease [Alicyclobacillus curvatus]